MTALPESLGSRPLSAAARSGFCPSFRNRPIAPPPPFCRRAPAGSPDGVRLGPVLVLDEPIDLPGGTEVALVPADEGDDLDAADRARLHQAL